MCVGFAEASFFSYDLFARFSVSIRDIVTSDFKYFAKGLEARSSSKLGFKIVKKLDLDEYMFLA